MIRRLRAFVFVNTISVLMLFVLCSFMIINGVFWLYEDFNGLEHIVNWYDVVSQMVHLLVAVFIAYLNLNGKYSFDTYDKVKDELSDKQIVIYEECKLKGSKNVQ